MRDADTPVHNNEFPEARGLRVALVHDWLNGMRGGEKVLEHFCALFPHANLYTLVYEPEKVSGTIRRMNVIESPFGRLPRARRNYRLLLPLMPYYVNQLPTADYDLVLATSHCVAKAAPPPERGGQLSYVFSPMRYVWDHYRDYLSGVWWKDAGLQLVRTPMQRWDRRTAERPDAIAADSAHIARKIARFWGREARVIHPSVDLEHFTPNGREPEDFFLVVSALVPYKHVERAIEAARLAGVRLVVAGDGPEGERLRALAGNNVEFTGWVSDEELPEYYRRARALLYPGVEDYGITALEAQACGRPVLALGKGGALETVVEGKTGRFFPEPSAKSLARLLKAHEDSAYDPFVIRRHAETFSPEAFRHSLKEWISETMRFLW